MRLEMSKAERLLSYSLLSLITMKPLAEAPMTGISDNEQQNCSSRGLLNSDGAWCWQDGCEGMKLYCPVDSSLLVPAILLRLS
jgi:sorting nexin-9/18/33